jgi:deazaflavin-dependent oxidoreductase (nitroreductase family)
MGQENFFIRAGNPFMKAILRSPLHGLLSGSTVLITVTGRKSGKAYATPVNYWRQGDCLNIVSLRNRTWWRNLRGGCPVTLRLQGQDVKAWATVTEDDQGVAASLAAYLRQVPRYAQYLGVTLEPNGQPKSEDIVQAARTRVIVQVKLN